MAKISVPADLLFGASQNKKNAGMMRLSLGNGEFLDIAKPIYEKAINGLLDSVEYDDSTAPLTVTNEAGEATDLKFHRVCGMNASALGNIEKAKAFVAAAEGVDAGKLKAAVDLAKAIKF